MVENHSLIFHGNRISLIGNVTHNFYGGDSEEKFIRNKSMLGESWEYYDSLGKLTYKYDKYGFRNHHSLDDIQHSPYIATVGCSHTMGTSIYYEDTYSCQLEALANIPVYNMGLGGSSNEVSFFNLIWLLTHFRPPKLIVFQETEISRFPLINENSITTPNGPWSSADNNLRDFIVLSDTIGYNKTKSLMLESMLKQLTDKHGIKLCIIPGISSAMPGSTEKGRDLVHGGKKVNGYVAKYIWSNASI